MYTISAELRVDLHDQKERNGADPPELPHFPAIKLLFKAGRRGGDTSARSQNGFSSLFKLGYANFERILILDKRYQVFVSSTFSDLEEERQEVMQALLELDCMPAGMELFPATNSDQWSLIKKVIDDSDYYIVILAGRYGSIGPDGLSYTEMEYRYAVETGKPVIGFIHKNKENLSARLCESTSDGKEKLARFEELVKNRLCRFWESPAELGSQVSRSLIKLTRESPAVGWVKGNLVASESEAQEILKLKRTIEELESQLVASKTTAPVGSETLSQGDDLFEFEYTFNASPSQWTHDGKRYSASAKISWNEIFSYVSPMMIDEIADEGLHSAVNSSISKIVRDQLTDNEDVLGLNILSIIMKSSSFQTVKVQLRALGLITKSERNRSVKDKGTYWTLTPYGENLMTTLRAIKK
ncbi:DUF4062 domain-containing protein [Enterobacter hormaechei]|uniref:DUF4062 domain-containing protein n=1 Tax=Enterobacter hormaechei TaxID=158836 RepID=UPI001FCF0668|nr:DUF4062 domain-containing protein [Enterobacter hormaechei]